MIQRSGAPLGSPGSVQSLADPITCGDLMVVVTGLRNRRGQMCFSLFAGEQGFPGESDQAVESSSVILKTEEPIVVFRGLQPGLYAIATFHDENGDGILNRGFLGIPKEGFGFSGNPLILMGPPKFQEAAIRVEGDRTTIQIQLKYF